MPTWLTRLFNLLTGHTPYQSPQSPETPARPVRYGDVVYRIGKYAVVYGRSGFRCYNGCGQIVSTPVESLPLAITQAELLAMRDREERRRGIEGTTKGEHDGTDHT